MRSLRRALAVALAAAGALAASAAPVTAQWQIESKDGTSSIKVGFLVQPQLETLETPDGQGTSTNLFLRRMRIIFGGKLDEHWTFFFETDSPNLGKGSVYGGVKDASPIYVQDAFVTYSHRDEFQVDAGMILTPLGHNHGQSAATLLAVDYGPYTFGESTPLQERAGRDYGAQVRGYPLGQHLEYRLGVFQGLRGTEAANPLRVAGRVVWYPFAADTGFFYAGTFQGSKRLVALGAAFDRQASYASCGVDAFVEQPLNGGKQGVTFQVNWMRTDGGDLVRALPRQDNYLVEAAGHFMKGRLSPLVQYAKKTFADPATPGQSSVQAGLAWWMKGFQRNLKLTAGRLHTDGQPDRTQALAQLQVFFF
jgi:hypothetical protein